VISTHRPDRSRPASTSSVVVSLPKLMTGSIARELLLGCEALPGVETDAGPVEHRRLDDRGGEDGVLLGAPHPLREGSVLRQDGGELVGDALGDAGAEQARRDRVDAN